MYSKRLLQFAFELVPNNFHTSYIHRLQDFDAFLCKDNTNLLFIQMSWHECNYFFYGLQNWNKNVEKQVIFHLQLFCKCTWYVLHLSINFNHNFFMNISNCKYILRNWEYFVFSKINPRVFEKNLLIWKMKFEVTK